MLRLWLSAATLAFSQSPSTAPLRLADVLAEVDARNPMVAAARERWEAARAGASGAAWPEQPRLDFERMYAPRGEDPVSGAEERSVSLTQSLPLPHVLYQRRRAAGRGADRAQAELEGVRLEVAAEAREAYAMLFLAGRSLALVEENIELMRGFARVAESKYSVGKASQMEVLKAQVELSRMLNMRITTVQERDSAAARLNALLDRPADAPLGVPEEPQARGLALDAAAVERRAAERRPEVRAAAAGVERARSELSLARAEWLPEFMVQYRRRDMRDPAERDSHDLTVGLSLPLWAGRQSANVRERKAEARMARAELDSTRARTRADARELSARLEAAQRLVELYRDSVLPQAEQSLRVALAAYRSDHATFLELLDSQRTLLELRIDHYAHLASYQTALGGLERVAGGDLEAP